MTGLADRISSAGPDGTVATGAPGPDSAGGVAAAEASGVRARLYDSRGKDRPVDITGEPPRRLRNDQLLWIDVAGRDRAALEGAARMVGLSPRTVEDLAQPGAPANVRRHDDYVHLGLQAAQPHQPEGIETVALDLIIAHNVVMTVRDGRVAAFDRFREEIDEATQVGRLDAVAFTTALVDSILEGFMALVEDLERRVDRLDQQALRASSATPIVAELAVLRARAARLRRALAPQRAAFATMARPDFELHATLGRPWPGLLDRVDSTLAAIETARDLLVGTFDIVMTGAAQRTNETVKALTVLAAVLLPANLIAAILGVNFALPIFGDIANFWWALAAMAALMVVTLAVVVVRDRSRRPPVPDPAGRGRV